MKEKEKKLGKWYLAYDQKEPFSGIMEQKKTPLTASQEKIAVKEAKDKWDNMSHKTVNVWLTKELDEFVHGPKSPRVIYEIPI